MYYTYLLNVYWQGYYPLLFGGCISSHVEFIKFNSVYTSLKKIITLLLKFNLLLKTTQFSLYLTVAIQTDHFQHKIVIKSNVAALSYGNNVYQLMKTSI